MTATSYSSGASLQIEEFVRARRASDSICDGYLSNLRRFDRMCAELFPGRDGLTQEMVDAWCERRERESANTCISRCNAVVALVKFLRARGETDVVAPQLPRRTATELVPHAFTEDELARLFSECDAYRGRGCAPNVARRNELVMPVVFRLLHGSGIRTCEARLLRRRRVDLRTGVMRIVEGKGRSERLVALHPSMAELMRRYDALMETLVPDREYFFPGSADGHLGKCWLTHHFRNLWSRVSDEPATVYQLRHAYAVRNIDGLAGHGPCDLAELEYLSKAMGHSSIEVTIASYYHSSPSLSEALQRRCADATGRVIPAVI